MQCTGSPSTMLQDRFSNEKYIDFVKLKLSLQYAKEGLEPVAERDVQTFFNNLSSQLHTPSSSSAPVGPTLCYACLKVDLKKQWSKQRFSCVGGVCDRWLGLIQQNHVNPSSAVEWDNFDVSQLPVSPWECAKVYLPYGSGKVKRAEDADLATILTLYLNCRPFASTLKDVSLCEKVKEVRNNLLHSGTMEIENVQFISDVGLVKQLLSDPAFAADKTCQDAIAKINKLLHEKLELSLNKELELQVLNRDIKYVAGKTDQLSLDVAGLTTQIQPYGQLGTKVTGVSKDVSDIKEKLGKHVTEVNKEFIDQKDKLEKHVTKVNEEVTGMKDQLGTQVIGLDKKITGMETKLATYVAEVNKEVTGVKDQLGTYKTEVIQEVTGVKDQLRTHVTEVDKEVTGMKDQLETTIKDIYQLQRVADLLCSFINACQIDKVDVGQLAASISTLLNLRDMAEKQGRDLAQLQTLVGRHEVTLKQHGGTLEQHGQDIDHLKEQIRHQSTTDGRDIENQGKVGIAALQLHLIAVYKDECKWENPITEDEDKTVSISKMYVKPAMKIVRQRDEDESLIEVKQTIKENESIALSYKQLFYTGTNQCTNIYIAGDAGMGKTTFCKQLVYTWCKAIQDLSEEGDSVEDLTTLKEFKILFYINLRDVESFYHIEDMIRENVLHDVGIEYNVSDILKTDKCLIVLDGLDEWFCPPGARLCRGLNKEIPGRNARNENCVFLTTTRNWKLDAIDLQSKYIDKHVEICGIGSSRSFAESVVRQLDPKSESNRQLDDFFMEVEDKKLDSLTTIPVLLTQLLTLWYFFKGLGKSQVQLYCKMLDLLFEKAKKHLPAKTSTVYRHTHKDAELPECLNEEDNCCNHTQLLLCLSKLAFSSLLNKKKEDSLVFRSSRLNVFGIDSSDISLCLKCGILTQSKMLSNATGKYKKYSFLHKKLQEFLAAVYLVTSENMEENIKLVKDYCNKLDTTLEMGQVFMFVCGMKSEVGNQLLEHLASLDSGVEHCTLKYLSDIMRSDAQTCAMACVAEGASNGLIIKVHLRDFLINETTISDYVNHVVVKKHTNIKSVHIHRSFTKSKYVCVVLLHLLELHMLEKLFVGEPFSHVPDRVLTTVINNNVSTLRSLCLLGVDLRQDGLYTAVLSCMPSLFELSLEAGFEYSLVNCYRASTIFPMMDGRFVRMTHSQIEQLLSAKSHLTYLQLDLQCSDRYPLCSPVIDLSNHTQLQTLCLVGMYVANLHAVAHRVKHVSLRRVTVAYSTLRQFIEALVETPNEVYVELDDINVMNSADPSDLMAYIGGCKKFTVHNCNGPLGEASSVLSFTKH